MNWRIEPHVNVSTKIPVWGVRERGKERDLQGKDAFGKREDRDDTISMASSSSNMQNGRFFLLLYVIVIHSVFAGKSKMSIVSSRKENQKIYMLLVKNKFY